MKRKMIIGIDARMFHHTGIGRYIKNLLRHMEHLEESKRYEFLVVDRNLTAKEEFRQIKLNCKVFSLVEQLELPMKIAKANLDLLHSPQFNIPLMSRAVQVTTIHDCAYDRFPEEFPNRLASVYYKFMFPLALQKSKRIIAVSESTKRDLIELYKIAPQKISVIYEGVDEVFFRELPNGRISELKMELRLDRDFALFVGLTRPRKNLERLLSAFAKLLSSLKGDVKLVLAGKVDTRFLDVRKLAEQLKISDNVIQLGFVPEDKLLPLYKAATFLVLPSLYEGFGLPVLEAMAAGTPVITSNVSSLPEVVDRDAILINPYDVDEIAEAMYKLFTDSNLREELRQKGRERARQFSWTKCAERTLKVYDEALQ